MVEPVLKATPHDAQALLSLGEANMAVAALRHGQQTLEDAARRGGAENLC